MHLVVAILGLFVVGLPGYFLARESGNPLYFAGALAAVVVSQILIAWGFARAARKL